MDAVERVEMLPCPFCGEAPFEVPQNIQKTALVQIKAVWCNKCKAQGPEKEAGLDEDDKATAEAIAAWNARALSLARSNGDEKLVLALKESRSGWFNLAAALRADGRNPEIAETYIEMIDEALLDRLRGSEDV